MATLRYESFKHKGKAAFVHAVKAYGGVAPHVLYLMLTFRNLASHI